MTSACVYCGLLELDVRVNGIDRLDSSKGYTVENCVPCCKSCNFMKGTFDPSTFLERCRTIAPTSFRKFRKTWIRKNVACSMAGLVQNAANFGRFEAKVGLVVAVVLALSSSACGAMSISSAKKDKHTSQTSGTLSATCTGNVCTGTVTYSGGTLPWSGPGPAPTNVTVWYDPANPSDAELSKSSVGFGIGLIGVGFCILLIAAVSYWMTMRFQTVAAAQGLGGAAGLAKNAFS